MPNGITSLPGFPKGLPTQLTSELSGFNLLNCFDPRYSPVIVIATYKGKTIPIQGATVTFFYSAVQARIRQLTGQSAYETAYTDQLGVGQACMQITSFVEARIQKSDIDFGKGIGVQVSIDSVSGLTRGLGPYVFRIAEARTPPPPPPCFGSIDLPNVYEVIGAFSAPPAAISPTGIPLPSVPRLTVNAVINNVSKSIPIAVIVDGKQVATAQSANGIDVLSIIRSLGPNALKTAHTIGIESRLPNCNLPNPPPINIPALSIPTPCTPPAIFNPVTGRCETPCTPPAIFNPVSGRCETPCTPPAIFNPVTGRCETPCPQGTILNPVTGQCENIPSAAPPSLPPPTVAPTPPSPAGKVVKIATIQQAYPGQEVPIVVTVLCGAKPSNGEWTTLFVDGKTIDEKRTSAGLIQYTWTAVAGTHRVEVDVPPSDFCPSPGRDAIDVDVSSQVPAIFEQLQREREAFTKSREALEAQRKQIRELQLPYTTVPIPSVPSVPSTGSVQIQPSNAPPGTTIQVGSQVIAAPTTSPVTVTLPPGTYPVIVTPPGGSPVTAPSVTIPPSPSLTPIPITLPTLPGG